MATYHVREKGRGSKIADYWPLIALVGVSLFAALALNARGVPGMAAFMGVFLIFFALLKIFDLKGFRRGFKMYDLLAKRVPDYAYVYPFVETGAGLLMIAGALTWLSAPAALFVAGRRSAGSSPQTLFSPPILPVFPRPKRRS